MLFLDWFPMGWSARWRLERAALVLYKVILDRLCIINSTGITISSSVPTKNNSTISVFSAITLRRPAVMSDEVRLAMLTESSSLGACTFEYDFNSMQCDCLFRS